MFEDKLIYTNEIGTQFYENIMTKHDYRGCKLYMAQLKDSTERFYCAVYNKSGDIIADDRSIEGLCIKIDVFLMLCKDNNDNVH